MNLKYRMAQVLLKAGWSKRDCLAFFAHYSYAKKCGIQRLQDCFARLHQGAVVMGLNSLSPHWSRMWAMCNCIRRGLGA